MFQPLGGVAVIADSTWAAFQGRKQLKLEWDLGPHASYDSAAYKKQLLAAVQQPGKVARSRGDVDAVFAKGGKVVEASYYVPHHAHATMEPPVAVADFRDGKVTAWAPVQNPQAAQDTVAAALGIDKSNVVCHVTLLGGGFGRKSKPDFVAEAALLSKKVGTAGQGRVEPRGRPAVRLLPRRRRRVAQGRGRRARPARRPGSRARPFRRSPRPSPRASATGWTSSWGWA